VTAHCRRHCCRSRARCTGPSRSSIDLVPGVHSRADIAAVASVGRCHPSDPVPTSPFRTVSPVFSAVCPACAGLCTVAGAGFAGLLHPAADPGVRYVSPASSVTPTPPSSRSLRLELLVAGHAKDESSQRTSPRRIPPTCRRFVLPRPFSTDGSVPMDAVSSGPRPTLPGLFPFEILRPPGLLLGWRRRALSAPASRCSRSLLVHRCPRRLRGRASLRSDPLHRRRTLRFRFPRPAMGARVHRAAAVRL